MSNALVHFDRAIALRPDYADALNNRARLRQLLDDLPGAAADFDRAAHCAEGELLATVLHNRATLRQAQRDFAGALADFDRALELVPDRVVTLLSRGQARKASDDLQGALADFDQALQQTPDSEAAPILHLRGGVHALRSDLSAALADYDRALRLNPEFWMAYVSRGHARCHQRDAGGFADYRMALRLNALGTLRELARLLREDAARDAPAVLESCDRYLRQSNRDALAHVRRGLTLILLGREEEAETNLACFVQLLPDFADHLRQLVDLLRPIRHMPRGVDAAFGGTS